MDAQLEPESKSPIARRFGRTFWLGWLRQPSLDVAESVIRLRRHRGMTQSDLAGRMGTKQPAIARIEAGDANVRLNSLVELAKALDTTVRIDLIPVEFAGALHSPRWWQVSELLIATQGTPYAAGTDFRIYQASEGLTPGDPGAALQIRSPEVAVAKGWEAVSDNLVLTA